MQDLLQASAEYTDSDFKSEDISKYRLSIQLRLDGFSFAVLDSSNLKLLQVKDYKLIEKTGLTQSEKWLRAQEYFQNFLSDTLLPLGHPQILNIVIDQKEYSLLPTVLTNYEAPEFQLKFSQDILYPNHIFINKIPGTDRNLIAAIYKPIFLSIHDFNSSASLLHAATVMQIEINKLHKNKKTDNRTYVSVSVHDMQILVMVNDKLLYNNSFSFTSKEEFVYFILLAYDQLNMNPEEDPLFFLGDINRTSPIYQICWQYIRHIHFIDQLQGISAGSAFDNMPISQYFILIQSALCEL